MLNFLISNLLNKIINCILNSLIFKDLEMGGYYPSTYFFLALIKKLGFPSDKKWLGLLAYLSYDLANLGYCYIKGT